MNLSIFEKYVNLCCRLSIKPSWKGLSEYYNHNVSRNSLRRSIYYTAENNYNHLGN